ncbi:MAG: hypothetical protein CVT80_17150 [Alphaproteobacteria bacterium HGW-Alphaproteobacteria-2]|nr:MAG: hypothetical protein CVT80_17150 [Alphaproteobacteria bacterium HGW-Alphaproteobacteria-2]
MTALVLLDYAAVLVFALTGALAASRQQLDIVGFAFVACLTAVGGGTLRDLLLDRNPVFWLGSPGYILVACTAALAIFLTAHLAESRYRLLLWLDSFALAVAVPAGVSAANEVPLVLKQGELYVTAAFAGALAAVLAERFTGIPALPLAVCALVTWGLRAGSLAFGWRLPVYRARPPR